MNNAESTTPSTIENALMRERKRRKLAEQLLEEKSRELFTSYEELERAHKDLKQNQRQLVQSEKMASIGTLAAGVAHEINNPVGYVLSNINTLKEYLPVFSSAFKQLKSLIELETESSQAKHARDKLGEYLENNDVNYMVDDTADLVSETAEGLNQISKIVQGLRTFAHEGDKEFSLTDINDCITTAHTLVQNKTKAGCEIELDLAPLPKIMANASKLGQVFLNLLVNASQAIDAQTGKIVLRSYLHEAYVIVEVCDNGCGVEEKNLEKLFLPFFTTKPVGEGTGLGLPISFGIVEEHQGKLEVRSVLGEGTTFTVCLPNTQEPT